MYLKNNPISIFITKERAAVDNQYYLIMRVAHDEYPIGRPSFARLDCEIEAKEIQRNFSELGIKTEIKE